MDAMISKLKALSDRNRLKIVFALTQYPELCACQITELLQVAGATASRHLEILLHSGLLDRRKDGRWVYYRLKNGEKDFAPVMNWIKNEFSKSNDHKFLNSLEKIASCDLKTLCGNK
jgi:ArsR family transcriptional regulator